MLWALPTNTVVGRSPFTVDVLQATRVESKYLRSGPYCRHALSRGKFMVRLSCEILLRTMLRTLSYGLSWKRETKVTVKAFLC